MKEGETMKGLTKILVLCVLFSLLFTMNVYAKDFSDVKSNAWYYEYVATASNKGWVSGYPDGSFKPLNNVTYAEAIAMVLRMNSISFGMQGDNWYDELFIRAKVNDYFPYFYEEAYSSANKYITREDLFRIIYFARDFENLDFRLSDYAIFEDVDKKSEWVNVPINTLAFLDVLTGYEENGKLYAKPNQYISRAELCTILSRVEGLRVNDLLLKYSGETIDISPYKNYKSNKNYKKLDFEALKPKKEEPKIEEPIVEPSKNVFVSKNIVNPKDKSTKNNPIQLFGLSNQQLFDVMRKSLAAGGEEIYFIVDMANYNQSQVSSRGNEVLRLFGDVVESLGPKYYSSQNFSLSYEMAPNSWTVNIGTLKIDSVNNTSLSVAVNNYNKLINYVQKDLTTMYSNGYLNDNMSDKEKALKIAEYISINMSYDTTLSERSRNPLGFFEGWKLTCMGYSGLFNTYLKELGIESYVLSGSAGGDHSWVISKLDDKWLMSDVTFADPIFTYNGVITQKFDSRFIAKTLEELIVVDREYGTTGRYIDSNYLNYVGLGQFLK